jgi:hypothetical protein
MKQLRWLICKAFVEKQKRESKATLFSFLPANIKELVAHLPTPYLDLSLGYSLENDILLWTHYSWLLPFLRSFSEKEICLFLSTLNQIKAKKIKSTLNLSAPLLDTPASLHPFFKQKMASFLLPKNLDLLPLQALPNSPLNILLDLSSKELHFIIEILGLHDLSIELKKIIDNTKLKKIYSIFPKEKQVYLKSLAHKNEPIVFKPIEIYRWDQKAESLLHIVLQRGLNRLAKAVYPENASFIWYIKHRMNIEEGTIFSSLLKKLEQVKAHSTLAKQVLEAVSFLQKINPPTDL